MCCSIERGEILLEFEHIGRQYRLLKHSSRRTHYQLLKKISRSAFDCFTTDTAFKNLIYLFFSKFPITPYQNFKL